MGLFMASALYRVNQHTENYFYSFQYVSRFHCWSESFRLPPTLNICQNWDEYMSLLANSMSQSDGTVKII